MSFIHPQRPFGDDSGGLFDWLTGGQASKIVDEANKPPPPPSTLDKGIDIITKIFGASAAASQANAAANYQATAAAQAVAQQARNTRLLIIGGIGLVGLYFVMKKD
jgi:hypothetical protein